MDRVLVEPLRQQRRVRRRRDRRRAEAADVPHRQRRSRRLDARLAAASSSAPRAATARSRTSRRSTRSPIDGGQEQPLPVDWGYWGSFSPDGKSLVFNRHPVDLVAPALSRQLRRRPLGRRTSPTRPTRSCSADERYNRYWPMWGADDAIYFVADPLPNDKSVKPGSPEVRKSVNNIYKIPAKGGQPVQVTKHTDGSLFWPSMSSDGKVIVYEDNFGIWKLDVATRPDQRDQDRHRHRREGERGRGRDGHRTKSTRSTSRRRAAARSISARGQILTIATDRGDITRVAPDKMASRNQSPKWSADGKYIAFVSDRSGRDEVWISRSRRPDAEEDHRPRQRKGRARLDAGFEVAALHGRRQEALQLHRRRRQDGGRRVERRRPHRIGRGLARQQVGRVLEAGPHAALARLHRADRRRRRAAHLGRQPAVRREQRGLDRRRPLPRLHVDRRLRATASRRRAASARRWSCGRCRCAIRIAIR